MFGHRNTRALPAGLATSTGIHILVTIYIFFWLTRPPAPLPQPVDLSRAIPVEMLVLPKPLPPHPEPPKPIPKHVEVPRPMPVPDVIQTQAPEPVAETPAVKPPPPPKDQPPIQPTEAPSVPYQSLVRTYIEKAKRYPREALMAGEEGTVTLFFVINRFGKVLAFRLDKSSHHGSLDAEAKRLIQRMQFPPVPDQEYPGLERIEFTIPVEFKLSG